MYFSNAYTAALATMLAREPGREPSTQKSARRHESTQRRKRTRRTGSDFYPRDKRKSRGLRKDLPFGDRGRTIYNADSYYRQRSVSPAPSTSSTSTTTTLSLTNGIGNPVRACSGELAVLTEGWDRQGCLRGASESYSEESTRSELYTKMTVEEEEMFALFINID